GPAAGRSRTTAVEGRHYALVVVRGLPPASTTPYRVSLDGDEVWPVAGSDLPPSVIRTADPARPLRVTFGSCRIEAPLGGRWAHSPDDPEPGHGIDALDALAEELRATEIDTWPDLLALLGDQVYADLVVHDPPVHEGPDAPPPGSLADLSDYVRLYHRTWGHPTVRWLLSTVPTAMVFDDHDVVDDWNLSAAWLEEIARQPWWDDRIAGGFVSYWLYQHWGNLAPSELAGDELARAVAEADDATDLLFGRVDSWRLDRPEPSTQRWSVTRDLGGTGTARLVLADTRNRRHLVEGERAVVDEDEMAWVADRARVDRDGVDHLLLGSSLPWLLPKGVHHLERWGEALGAGRWGRPGRRFVERFRAGNDTEHWPSFGRSFDDLGALLRSIGSGEQGPAPATALVLSGDVHFSYLAPADVGPGVSTRVVQLVSSPFRHGVPKSLRRKLQLASSRVGGWGGRVLRLTAAPGRDPVRWSLTGGPWFGNGLAALELDGRRCTVTFSRAVRAADGRARLETVHREDLTR
ncbi:MAG TPA: alkaline phosphatase D family protein, partial [Iamia sp.]|nr:alkaline phosphatase D family protein [Iamia sp.]